MENYITILDFAVLPIVLFIIYFVFLTARNKWYPKGHPWRPYFIPALTLKIIGGIAITLIYVYYYKGGDTINYFAQAKVINSALEDSFVKWFGLLTRIPSQYSTGYYQYISQLIWYADDPATYYTCAVTAVVNLFTFQTLLPTAVVFATISFTGIWAMFRTFATIYPHLAKHLAICICFIPSVIVWGSGIFKDTICMFALGWLCYTVFEILIKRNFSFPNIILLIISVIILRFIKVYILMAFLPAIVLWILFNYSKSIKDVAARIMLIIIVTSATIAVSYYIFTRMGEESLGRYSLEKIAKTVVITRDYIIEKSSDESSAYDLGEYTSIQDMILKAPAAINVTLFRPYIWESKKVLVMLTALESLLFLLITIKVIIVVGLRRVWRTIVTDPNIQFFLIFTLVFSFAIGLTSGNFGTLSRYKIPCLPFYGMALVLIYYKNMPLSKKLFRPIGL